MQKKNFVSLILGTIGGILFAIGMCMCLLPEWGAFTQGVVIAVIGAVVLLILLLVRRKMEGKPAIHLLPTDSVMALFYQINIFFHFVWKLTTHHRHRIPALNLLPVP